MSPLTLSRVWFHVPSVDDLLEVLTAVAQSRGHRWTVPLGSVQ